MFRPNTRAMWQKKKPVRSITGKASFEPPVILPCAIVSLTDLTQQSAVRADSSASHAAADENVAAAKLLVPPQFVLSLDDVLTIAGKALRVTSVEPRLSTQGILDHYEVLGEIKADL